MSSFDLPTSIDDLEVLPLAPLRDVVIFPHMMLPFVVGRKGSVLAVDNALMSDKRIMLATQHDAKVDNPSADDIYRVGTVANIVQSLKLANGNIKVLVEGVSRAKVIEFDSSSRYFRVTVALQKSESAQPSEAGELSGRAVTLFEEYMKVSHNLPYDSMAIALRRDDIAKLSDVIGAHLLIGVEDKQALLEELNPLDRLQKVVEILESEIEKLHVDRRIHGRARRQMEKAQKEYYLNEKIKAIQQELGEKDERAGEVEEFRKKIQEAKMPKLAQDKAEQELKRLEAMPPMSAEGTVSRNYLDWLVTVPWHKRTREIRNIKKAEKILNDDHYGLEKIKERILEFLAVRQLVSRQKGQILCFAGPPGVGKSSLASSIARATGRKFVRLSLGGVRDEAEIRGHRRTYIGAFPGQIIQMMKKAGTRNPVFLLDEIDKMSMDFRGDPSSALMEVLDPEQNQTFVDHYLDVEFDLSDVFFVATANVLHTIPGPLRDRMEIMSLPGYTEEEKIQIAIRYLLPKQIKAHGLKKKNLSLNRAGLQALIRNYTREAGVRNVERSIASTCRKVARKILDKGRDYSATVNARNVARYLGPPRYRTDLSEKQAEIGLCNGLAWTEAGGELLKAEVAVMSGTGKLVITGKLGEVMQESAKAAISCVRSHLEKLGLDGSFREATDIHIHVPEGAIPKDGPSAGTAMAAALMSALVKVPVKNDVAMTGEITLRGKVLPIGGVKEKVLAAHRAGVKTVLLPDENRKDVVDIPATVTKKLELVFVKTLDEVIDHSLTSRLSDLPNLQTLFKKEESSGENLPTQSVTH